MNTIEKPGLVNRNIDGMVAGFQEEVTLFRGFDADRQQYRAAAGSTDPEVTVPFIDVGNNFRDDSDVTQGWTVMRMGMHDARIIGWRSKNRYGSGKGGMFQAIPTIPITIS